MASIGEDDMSASKNANYRKLNDGSHNSSKYHKKDGTSVRAIMKREVMKITFDQWAESGGTAGMFARGIKKGTIVIVQEEDI